MDADTNPKLKHAHSFDFDNFIHQRDITERDRHLIEEYYNSLNLSVYPDHKHHFTLARVHTTHHSNFSGIEMRMVGYFKPESKHYPLDQRIEDYIYIDVSCFYPILFNLGSYIFQSVFQCSLHIPLSYDNISILCTH